MLFRLFVAILVGSLFYAPTSSRGEQVGLSPAIAANGATPVMTVHAQGAQVYECKRNAAGDLAWQFREPIATLWLNGQTVGVHYAGPGWELNDGSSLVAKVAARAPGASPQDIPLLKLSVTSRRPAGKLAGVSMIQRINTQGGVLEGACQREGEAKSVAYAADYVFLSGGQQY